MNNIIRRPFRERFSILLGEFGTGLAGRGEELNEVIHRANPALRETDRVLAVLAQAEPRAGRASRVTPTRRWRRSRARRRRVADFIEQANATGEATAERRADIEAGIQRLPRLPARAAAR